jgi:ATP-dependent exoDNAse (exonuclease V) alpha subunit
MRIPPAGDLLQHLKVTLIKYFKQYMEHTDNICEYENMFTMFSRFRILCALRRGPYGVTEINRLCERIYTAITRARKSVTVWGEEELFIRAVSRRSVRSSGLRDALWKGGQEGAIYDKETNPVDMYFDSIIG